MRESSVVAMHRLIDTIDRVRDQILKLGADSRVLDLPRIVVIGTQSSGKSSVLESVVGHSFLPRGTGVVTRCPLELRLHHCPPGDARRSRIEDDIECKPSHSNNKLDSAKAWVGAALFGAASSYAGCVDWGEFSHLPGRAFKMHELQAEIERRTVQLAGSEKNIVSTPIVLDVYSSNVPDLTLVDTPGITKIPIAGQPEDIELQIRGLIQSYIEQVNSLILVVHPANVDMTTCDVLKLAQEVDPDGDRTIAVITKLDLMDVGTSAEDMLIGNTVPVKLGIIGVKNRSQQDIVDRKSLKEALADERKYLQRHYPALADKNGTEYLARALSEKLGDHIKKCIPELKERAMEQIDECERILSLSGEAILNKKSYINKVVPEFARAFERTLEGRRPSLDDKPLSGGAKICFHFEKLQQRFQSINPCRRYTLEEVSKAIMESNGTRPTFLVSQDTFETMVMPLIREMLPPAHECVREVMAELRHVSGLCVPEDVKLRFPRMAEILKSVVQESVEEFSEKTFEVVSSCVEMEENYITYGHMKDIKDKYLRPLGHGETAPPTPPVSSLPFKSATSYPNRCSVKVSPPDVNHIMLLGKMLDFYHDFVGTKVADTTAKAIMKYLVEEVLRTFQVRLLDHLADEDVQETAFKEDPGVAVKRAEATKKLEVLNDVLDELNNVAEY